jgi:hypothetical protein
LCPCNARCCRKRGSTRGQMQESSAGMFHCVAPWRQKRAPNNRLRVRRPSIILISVCSPGAGPCVTGEIAGLRHVWRLLNDATPVAVRVEGSAIDPDIFRVLRCFAPVRQFRSDRRRSRLTAGNRDPAILTRVGQTKLK